MECEQVVRALGFRGVLKRALGGGKPLRQDETRDSQGRDAMAELNFGVAFANAGATQLEFQNPDLRFRLNGEAVHVAVKRLKSEGEVENHIVEARQQISELKRPGVIAIDASALVNRSNRHFTEFLSDERLNDRTAAIAQRLEDMFTPTLCARGRGPWVIGAIVYVDVISPLPGQTTLTCDVKVAIPLLLEGEEWVPLWAEVVRAIRADSDVSIGPHEPI